MKLTIKQKRRKFLLEACEHFNIDNLALKPNGNCVYDHNSNGGCIIGRNINQTLAKKLDSKGNSSIDRACVWKLLPAPLKILGHQFLSACQSLHDYSGNWCDSGLSARGILRRDEILSEFCSV